MSGRRLGERFTISPLSVVACGVACGRFIIHAEIHVAALTKGAATSQFAKGERAGRASGAVRGSVSALRRLHHVAQIDNYCGAGSRAGLSGGHGGGFGGGHGGGFARYGGGGGYGGYGGGGDWGDWGDWWPFYGYDESYSNPYYNQPVYYVVHVHHYVHHYASKCHNVNHSIWHRGMRYSRTARVCR